MMGPPALAAMMSGPASLKTGPSVTLAKRGFTTAALAWNGHRTAHTLSSLTAGGNVPGAGPRLMMEMMETIVTLTIPSPPWLGLIAHKES